MSVEYARWVLEDACEAESLRRVLRRALEQNPQRLVAVLVGITRSSLRKFMAMSHPDEATLDRIREFCRDRPEPETPPQAVALAVLASAFPASRRLHARRELARTLLAFYLDAALELPAWLQEECGGADPGQRRGGSSR